MQLDDKMLLLLETPEQIYERVANRAKDKVATGPGEDFYVFAYPICQEIAEQQELWQYGWLQAFLLWADGEFLDWIGARMRMPRLKGEEDEPYRQRLLSDAQEEEGSGRVEDYERIARNSGAGYAKGIEHMRNNVSIDLYITDLEGNPASPELCEKVRLELEKYRYALHDIQVHPAATHVVHIEARPILSPEADRTEIEAAILKKLKEYMKKDVLRYQVIANLIFVPGVEDLENYTLNGGTSNLVTPDGAVNVLEWSWLP